MTDPFGPGGAPTPEQPQQPTAPQPPPMPHQPGSQPPTIPQPNTPQQPTAPQQPTVPQQPTAPGQPPVNPNQTAVQPPGAMPQAPAGASPPPGYPTADVMPAGGVPPTGSAPPGFPAAGAAPELPGLGGRPFAGFGSRLIATLVDGVVGTIILTLISIPFIAWMIASWGTEPDGCNLDTDVNCKVSDGFAGAVGVSLLALFVLAFVFAFFYYVRPIAKSGQTVGRRVANIRVIDELTGQPPSLGKSLVRYLIASLISGAIFYLGYLWMLWDDKNQTWHDKVAGTVVVGE